MGKQIGFTASEEIKIPKRVKGKINNGHGDIEFEHPPLFSETLTESQEKIVEICDAIKDLLLYKNQQKMLYPKFHKVL